MVWVCWGVGRGAKKGEIFQLDVHTQSNWNDFRELVCAFTAFVSDACYLLHLTLA